MYRTSRRIEFRDTDAAGIAHFSVFFPMMESAEHEMLRSLEIEVLPQRDGADLSPITWPRVSAQCDYRSAARFEDILEIAVTVERIGRSSVTYAITFERDGTSVASGTLTAVCCRLQSGGKLQKVEIPPELREKLDRHSRG